MITMTMMTMRIIQGVGVTVGLSVRWRHQGFGIICPTCFLFTRFSKDLGLLAPPRILDFGLFAQLAFSSESENYFYMWDLPRILDYLSKLRQSQKTISGFGIICPTKDLGFFPNLPSFHQSHQRHQSLQGFGIIGATKDSKLFAQLAFSSAPESENYLCFLFFS